MCYPYEWSFGQVKDAALTLLRIVEICEGHDYHLQDSHLSNLVYFSTQLRFVDIGSFLKGKCERVIPCNEFTRRVYLPLKLMSQGDIYWGNRLLHEQWVRYLLPNVPIENLKLFESYTRKFISRADLRYIRRRILNRLYWQFSQLRHRVKPLPKLGEIHFDIPEMRRIIEQFHLPVEQTANAESHRKGWTEEMNGLSELLSQIDWSSAALWVNDGLDMICRLSKRFESQTWLCSTHDMYFAENLYQRAKQDRKLSDRLTVAYQNVLLLNHNAPNYRPRFTADVVICLDVFSELKKRYAVDLDQLIKILSSMSREYVVLEFCSSKDNLGTQKQVSTEEYEALLKNHLNIVDTAKIGEGRFFYLGRKKG